MGELDPRLLAALPAGAELVAAVDPSAMAVDEAGTVTVELPDGHACRLPLAGRADERRAAAAAFAVASADALARTLNVRRTVSRLADLAVPRFGERALVAVLVEGGVRAARAGASAGRSGSPGADVVAAWLAAQVEPVCQRALPADDPALAELGLGGGDGLGGDGGGWVLLSTVAVRDPVTGTDGLLAVSGSLGDVADPAELVALARRGATAVSAARVYEERASLADRLRASLLPAPLPAIDGVQLGASYRPARQTIQLGGDFYDVFPAGKDAWSVSIGDVCGKGVDAAVLTGQVRQSLRTACRVTDDPSDVLRLVNDTLLTGDGSTFVTLLHATLRPVDSGIHLRLASGGHPPPLLLRGGRIEVVGAHGTIVGMLDDVDFATVDTHLAPGDTLLMFTDGVLEAGGPDSLLGVRPVADLLADCADLTAQVITERVLQLVLEHLDHAGTADSHDDIAVLAVRADPAAIR